MPLPLRRAALAGALSLFALVPAQTQTPAGGTQPTQPVFRTGVSVVRVDVSVTGKGQKPIEDLAAGDFELEEDGVPQRVDTAQFVKRDGRRSINSAHGDGTEHHAFLIRPRSGKIEGGNPINTPRD